MSDFTIEQLEALKEGTTPGPWSIDSSDPDWPQLVGAVVLEGNLIRQEILAEVGGELNDPNLYLAASAPALVDALIAEKQAHQKLRAEVEKIRDAHWEQYKALVEQATWLDHKGDTEADEVHELAENSRKEADRITRILEGDNADPT